MRYRYIASVLVRPVGAQGIFTPTQFPVLLADAKAHAKEVTDANG